MIPPNEIPIHRYLFDIIMDRNECIGECATNIDISPENREGLKEIDFHLRLIGALLTQFLRSVIHYKSARRSYRNVNEYSIFICSDFINASSARRNCKGRRYFY